MKILCKFIGSLKSVYVYEKIKIWSRENYTRGEKIDKFYHVTK